VFEAPHRSDCVFALDPGDCDGPPRTVPVVSDLKTRLPALSAYAYERTRARLEGMSDEEYLWEPVENCWTLRPTATGALRADFAPRPEVEPFTTIAWRLWHLIGCYGGERNPRWLGVEVEAAGFDGADPAPGTAAEAISALERAHGLWQEVMAALPAERWREKLGPIAGPYAEDDKAALVLHQIDEQIHHGAEIGVLRDLFRARSGPH